MNRPYPRWTAGEVAYFRRSTEDRLRKAVGLLIREGLPETAVDLLIRLEREIHKAMAYYWHNDR